MIQSEESRVTNKGKRRALSIILITRVHNTSEDQRIDRKIGSFRVSNA